MAKELIQEIHKTNYKFVIVASGGGSIAISDLLSVPGASNTVLETYTPYARESLAYYLLRCLLYTSPSPRDATLSRMPSSA